MMSLKNNSSHLIGVIISLTLILAASACSGPGSSGSVTSTLPGNTSTVGAPPTAKPSNTPRPTSTTALTPTATNNPTATASPTLPPPADDFSQVELLTYGPLPDWQFSFTFQFPSPVKGEYYVETRDPQKVYPCRPLLEYNHPERLVCLGRIPAFEKNVDFTLRDSKTDIVLYSNRIAIPFQ